MSENIVRYIGVKDGMEFLMKQTLYLVEGYSNKTYEDKKSKCKSVFENAKQHRIDRLAYYEGKPKEYKAIKRYGGVLEKIERLLGIVPDPKKEFSLEDLSEKLKAFSKTRENIDRHTMISYFQNVLTDTITNLLKIEQEYTDETSALNRVATLKGEILRNKAQIPNELQFMLRDSFDKAENMLESYAKYVLKANIKYGKDRISLRSLDTNFSERQQVVSKMINTKAKDLLGDISNLDRKMECFEPQVDLTALAGKLEKADDIMTSDLAFDPDNLDSVVTDLELTTDSLTSEQNYRNEQSESLCDEINTISSRTEGLSKESLEETTHALVENVLKRNSATEDNAEVIKKMAEEGNVDERFLAEVADTMTEQSKTDFKLGTEVASANTGVSNVGNISVVAENIEDNAKEILDIIDEKLQERDPFYGNRYEDEEDERNGR